jgi:diguanylate cyclase (GGDEF)-like protein/PAS domain S-box-containing protein
MADTDPQALTKPGRGRLRRLALGERAVGSQPLGMTHPVLASARQSYLIAQHLTDLVMRIGLDGTIHYASPSARRVLGWEPTDLEGHQISEFWHPEDQPGVVAPVVADAGEVVTSMRRIRRADGSYAWCESLAQLVPCGANGSIEVLTSNRDITERVQAAARLAQSERRWLVAFDAAPVGMAEVGLDGRFWRVNPALCDLLGFTGEELLAMTTVDLAHPDDVAQARQVLLGYGDGAEACLRGERRYVNANGRVVWAMVNVMPMFDASGAPEHLLAHFVDITERKRGETALEHLANHDPLTGLLNRRGFEIELQHQVNRVANYGPAGALLVVDLDRFKSVNDRFGHAEGDRVLVAVARALTETLRATDAIGRLGGDEFAVIAPDVDGARAEVVAHKLLTVIRASTGAECAAAVTASIGVALFDAQLRLGPEVAANADAGMYAAKAGGRDCYVVCATPPGNGAARPHLRVVP